MAETIRLATRGSDLARRQAASVADRIEDRRTTVELVEVETTGDRIRDELVHRLGRTGAFVRALDERVMDGEVDAAVHSMKDMPTEFPDELVVAGVPERATPGDVLVTPTGDDLRDLPDGATVGTSSLRRKAQLLAARPDLQVEPLRGNVDTRIEKLLAPHLQAVHERKLEAQEAGELDEADVDRWFEDLAEIERRALGRETDVTYDAIVLAAAGLERLDLLEIVDHQSLSTDEFVPAAGQGAIAVTALDGELAERLHDRLDHPRSRVEATVERTVLARLGGGCVAPIGVHAVLQGEFVHTVVRVLSQDGTETVAATRDLPVERHGTAAREFAADLDDRGAGDLIDRARKATDTNRDE